MEEMNKYFAIGIIILIIGFIFVFKLLKKLIKAAIVIAVVVFGLSVVTQNEISFEKVSEKIPHLVENFDAHKLSEENKKFDLVKEISTITELLNSEKEDGE